MSQKIAAKLASVMKDVDVVLKGGENKAQNYKYVRATDVANEVRKALGKHGVAFTYEVLSERFWDAQTRSGSTQFYCSLHVKGTFHDAESGESLESSVVGWGADTGDKAPYKALTGALKYIMRCTYLIPDENDPENDKHEPEEVESGSVKQEKPKIQRKPRQTDFDPETLTVTPSQAKAFIDSATENGWSKEQIVFALNSKGLQKTTDIPQADLAMWMSWAEKTGELN